MDCLFCNIASKACPSDMVYETDQIVAIKDIHPQAPVHLLIIPKGHHDSLLDMHRQSPQTAVDVHEAVQTLVTQYDLHINGFRVVVNTGSSAGQTVLHVHYHLLGGRDMHWPPG